ARMENQGDQSGTRYVIYRMQQCCGSWSAPIHLHQEYIGACYTAGDKRIGQLQEYDAGDGNSHELGYSPERRTEYLAAKDIGVDQQHHRQNPYCSACIEDLRNAMESHGQ